MSNIWKRQQEIDAELVILRDLKGKVRKFSMFGDDHRAAIDAQCNVLEKRMDTKKINELWGDEDADGYAQNILEAAFLAGDWMTGALAEDEGKPSDEWAELVQG